MWISRKEYRFLKKNAEKNIDAECALATAKENQRLAVARAMEEYSSVLQERDMLRLAVSEFELDDKVAARISRVVQQNAMTLDHCADVLEAVAPYCTLWTTDGFLKRFRNAFTLYQPVGGWDMIHDHKRTGKHIPAHERRNMMRIEFSEEDLSLFNTIYGDEDEAMAAVRVIMDAPPEIQILAIQLVNYIEEVA